MTKYIIIALIIASMGGYIYYLKNEITQLEANQVVLDLSNKSLQEQRERDLKVIEDANSRIQTYLDSKIKVMQELDEITQKYNSTNIQVVEIIEDKGVLSDELRKELRKDLTTPLPSFPAQ